MTVHRFAALVVGLVSSWTVAERAVWAGEDRAELAGRFQLEGERWTYRDGSFEMSGILLRPDGDGPFPAVLISHGLGGSAERFGLFKAREFVKWGLVSIAPDYTHVVPARPPATSPRRGQPADYGASAENLRRARTCIEILQGLPYVDGRRIAAYGHSMGGFVTIGLAAAAPDLLRAAAVSGSGVAPRAGFPAPAASEAAKIRTPFLILHGADDETVRPEQSAALQAALQTNGVACLRHVYEGEGHPIDQTKRDDVFQRVKQWFAQYGVLPGGAALQDPETSSPRKR